MSYMGVHRVFIVWRLAIRKRRGYTDMAKILIAEDDRISQKLAVKIVEELGHTAYVSPHGKHAYEALTAANDFDMLITDIMMPEMDGQQLIKTLRGDQQFMDFPIIIMS